MGAGGALVLETAALELAAAWGRDVLASARTKAQPDLR
jgi:hypothetical protein